MTDFTYQGEDFEDKVVKQVEFYFSDSNLQTDKFLWKIYEANDGWVELKTLMTFGRMRQYRPEEKVIASLKNSEKLVLSANEESIRRKDPLKDLNELKTIRKRNTVHIEGFPHELSQEQVESWFNEKIAAVLPKKEAAPFNSIRRIRTRQDKKFFGVVDVEFKNGEDAEYFLKEIEVSYPAGVAEASEKAEEGAVVEEEEEAVADEPAESEITTTSSEEKSDKVVDKKSILRKMSLLTFQEMKESGKRFGVNDVTKRRNSFNDNRGKRFNKGGNKKFRKNDNRERKEGSESESKSEPEQKAAETAVESN
ncbi:la protein homolog [[Candida] railenensis]|uniref:La protein homolog n=1 Tax=[Candida] railenensis TaxID=45579 RepID=A0A9P0VZ31_9ASCO|nr:la protein homolog [[Candida] railenensis]